VSPVNVVIALAVVLAGLGFLLLMGSLLRRRPPASAGPSGVKVLVASRAGSSPHPAPTAAAPVPDSPEVQVDRRHFLNVSMLLATTGLMAGMGAGTLALLWPNRVTGFGGIIRAGNREQILEQISSEGHPYYNPEGRYYLVPYDTSDESNPYVEAGVAAGGLMALYQKCAHLGCRVPFCETSQWFECPCHGSKYNYAGEVMANSPAPAGLWRFKITIENDVVMVDTSEDIAQPAKGVDTINQPPAGPNCIGAAEGSH
jgi:cytochrome b6-f complex iron-sulfur subunit